MSSPDEKRLVQLEQAIQALSERLSQERARNEFLRHRLNQQEAQIRDLQRTTRSILDSRIWKALVRMGGHLLWLGNQRQALGTRLRIGAAPITGATDEPIQLKRELPANLKTPLSGKIRLQGWAIAQSGVREVRVRVDGGEIQRAKIGLPRPDVYDVHPGFKDSDHSGFRVALDLTSLTNGAHTVSIEVVSNRGGTKAESFPIIAQKVGAARTEAEIKALLKGLPAKPLISILTPVYNVPEKWLRCMIDSVLGQYYSNWELCLADDRSTEAHVRRILEEYRAKDSRIKVIYRETNGHIAKATNSALDIATGDFVALVDHDDEITPDALLEAAVAINENPTVDMIYSDEDKIDEDDVCHDPFYKPDWSPEYQLTCMYTCHLGLYRTSIVRELGGFRPEVNGAQDYDLALRFAARTNRIHHIPKVLYHWRMLPTSTASGADAKDYAYPAARAAIQNYLELSAKPGEVLPGPREGFHRVLFHIKGKPKVSIVIPTAGKIIEHENRHIDLLRMCVGSILSKSTWPEIEIVVIHNHDLQPETEKWLQMRTRLVGYDYDPANFNLAAKINLGARHASGEHLILLNDDIEVIAPDWIENMLRYSQQPEIGAVGAKLLFPNQRIQHAGVLLLNGTPGHCYYDHPPDEIGYYLSVQLVRNYIAVTGACMMTRHELWDQVGGFSEDFPLNYNDVDYCLKVREAGCRTVYVPEAELFHYESVSREAARGVKEGELEHFQAKWLDRYFLDPYYNPNLPVDYPYYYPPDQI